MLNFFGQKPFGLDISDYSIEIVSLGGSEKNPRLLAMGRIILEAGLVEDGIIRDKEKLKKYLCSLIEKPEFGKLKTKRIIFSLPESKSFIYVLPIPSALGKKKEEEEIKSQIEKIFPYSLKELYFDYKIRKGTDFAEILIVASPQKIIEDYLEIFKNCQLQPIALEIESESLARSLASEEKEPFLIADIGARTANFSVFDEIGLRLSISLPIAGNRFTQALSEKLKVSLTEAENLKRKIGLNPDLKEGKVFLILQGEIQKIIFEIEKIDSYFQKKTKREIKKIILAGGSASLPHLADYLTENLEKPTVISDPWLKIDIDILRRKEYFKKALKINPLLYAAAIGSGLRGLTKKPETVGLNLLSKGRKITSH